MGLNDAGEGCATNPTEPNPLHAGRVEPLPAPGTFSDLDLLGSFLACRSLPHNWYDSYGVRKARSDALTRSSTRKAGYSSDSFINPNSETALTLFVLGNTDGWRQVNAFPQAPRVAGKDWNYKFFADLLAGRLGTRESGNSLWRYHAGDDPIFRDGQKGSLFLDDPVDWNNLVVLFEVEVAGKTFHQRTAKQDQFTGLSFLNVDDLKKWSKFDAVLIDPTNRCFYFIEAKLRSDSSTGTKKYPHVNQIVRSLEAAFWLTSHPDSNYDGWGFRYVFVSPHLVHDYKLRYYAFALGAVDEMLSNYRRLLQGVYGNDLRPVTPSFDQRFGEFRQKAREAVRVVHWDAFGKVLLKHRPQVWDDYFGHIGQLYSQARPAGDAGKVIQNIKKRLQVAGIEYRE